MRRKACDGLHTKLGHPALSNQCQPHRPNISYRLRMPRPPRPPRIPPMPRPLPPMAASPWALSDCIQLKIVKLNSNH